MVLAKRGGLTPASGEVVLNELHHSWRRPLWLTALVPLIAAGAAMAPAPAAAATAISCQHLHLTYSFQAVGVAYPASVFSSSCSVGAGVPMAASGTGSFLLYGLSGPSVACNVLDECDHYDLTISFGSVTINPGFDVGGPDVLTAGLPISSTTLDYVSPGTIIKFSTGTGSGAINSVCKYDPVSNAIDCTADGWFTWLG